MTEQPGAQEVPAALRPTPPWLLRVDPATVTATDPAPATDAATDVESRWSADVVEAGGRVVRLRGVRMRSEPGLHAEVARRLHFPDYYGANWNALADCLSDLSWLPAAAYLVVIEDAGAVLADEPAERLALLGDLLTDAASSWAAPVTGGAWWDRRPVPFHVLLLGDPRRWAEAGLALGAVSSR